LTPSSRIGGPHIDEIHVSHVNMSHIDGSHINASHIDGSHVDANHIDAQRQTGKYQLVTGYDRLCNHRLTILTDNNQFVVVRSGYFEFRRKY